MKEGEGQLNKAEKQQPEETVENLELNEEEKKEKNEKFSHDAVRKYAREYFENIISSREIPDSSHMSFFAMEEIQNNLSVLSNCEREWKEERLYSENFREATNIFLEELINFSKEKENDERINMFLETIQQMFFSSSPSLSSALDLRQHFNFSAKATRSKKLQPFIGGGVIGDLAYKIGWDYNPDAKKDKLLEGYNEGSISERLDKLNLTEMLGAELIGAGSSYNYGDKKFIKFFRKIKKENKNAFIGYCIDMVEGRLRQEYKTPSRGPVQYSNDPGNARLWGRMTEEEIKRSGELQNIIIPNRALIRGEKFAWVADNVVAIIDHSNLPVEYAKVNLGGAEGYESKISGTFLVKVKDTLKGRKKGGSDIIFDRLVDLSNENIFIPRNGIKDNDSEKLAAIWERFGDISKEDWKDYFELNTFRNEFINKVEEFKRGEIKRAEERNFQATLKMFDTYKHEVPHVLSHFNNSAVSKAYEEFIEAYESGDHEYAFDKVNHLAMAFRHDGESKKNNSAALSKIRLLAQEFINLRDTHTVCWDECNNAINDYQNRLSEEFQEKIIKFNEIADRIKEDQENILNGFETELDLIIDEEGKNKFKAEFVPFSILIKREGGILKNLDTEDSELLFQHLYRPAMKQKIENEFGIKFNELPFHYHAYFLKFLSEKDIKSAKKVKIFLDQAQDEDSKKNRIKSFLSLESGQEMGDKILNIGESLKDQSEIANLLFSEYARIVDEAEKSAEEINKIYNEVFFEKQADKNQIVQAIMKKANGLLSEASEELKKAGKDEKNKIIKELIRKLWREEKTRKRAIEDLKGVQIELNKQYKIIGRSTMDEELIKELDDIENGLLNSEKFDKKTTQLNLEKIKKYQKYDSNRIKEFIEHYEIEYILTDELINSLRNNGVDEDGIKRLKESLEKEERPKYEPIVKNLKKLLVLQQNLERKLDEFVYGRKSGVDLPEELKNHISHKVFEKYEEIVNLANRSKRELKELYGNQKEASDEEIEKISDKILAKANQILNNFSQRIIEGEEIDEAEIIKELEEYKAEAIVFASIFQTAYKKERLSFGELRGVEYQIKNSIVLGDEEKEMIEKVVKYNYPKKKQQADILEKIKKSFNSKDTNWHLLTRQEGGEETLIACIRFDEIDDNNVYAATFNVGIAYRGSSLGEAMFDRVMTEVAEEKRIKAIAEVGKEVTNFYINKGGFNVAGTEENKKTGIDYYKIERYDPENEFYGSKKVVVEEKLLAYYNPKAKISDLIKFQRYILVKKEDKDKTENLDNIRLILQNEYVMTRIISNKNKKDNFFVFEKKLAAQEGIRAEAA